MFLWRWDLGRSHLRCAWIKRANVLAQSDFFTHFGPMEQREKWAVRAWRLRLLSRTGAKQRWRKGRPAGPRGAARLLPQPPPGPSPFSQDLISTQRSSVSTVFLPPLGQDYKHVPWRHTADDITLSLGTGKKQKSLRCLMASFWVRTSVFLSFFFF